MPVNIAKSGILPAVGVLVRAIQITKLFLAFVLPSLAFHELICNLFLINFVSYSMFR